MGLSRSVSSQNTQASLLFIKKIVSTIGMVPHVFNTLPSAGGEKYFVVNMSKLDDAYNYPDAEDIDDDDNLKNTYDNVE